MPNSPELSFASIRFDERTVLLSVAGRLDHSSAPTLNQELARLQSETTQSDARISYWLLDLSQTSFIDSAGMRVLLALQKELEQQTGQLILIGEEENKAIESIHCTLDELFTIAPNLAVALSLLDID